MSRIQAIKSSMGLTNINVRSLQPKQKKAILNSEMYEAAEKLANKMGVDVDIKQIRQDGRLTAHLRTTSYQHILDASPRELYRYQGDSLLIPVTKNATVPAHANEANIISAVYGRLATLAEVKGIKL